MASKKVAKVGGRPPHEPTKVTRSIVKTLVAAGLTQVEIAKRIGISENTLPKYYREELDTGWIEAVGDAAGVILSKMRDPNGDDAMEAAKFFLSRRGKGLWSEQKNVEISGPNGGGVPVRVDIDALDYEELRAIDEMLSPLLIEGTVVSTEEDDANGAD